MDKPYFRTQTDLASAAGISQANLSKILKEQIRPTKGTAEKPGTADKLEAATGHPWHKWMVFDFPEEYFGWSDKCWVKQQTPATAHNTTPAP